MTFKFTGNIFLNKVIVIYVSVLFIGIFSCHDNLLAQTETEVEVIDIATPKVANESSNQSKVESSYIRLTNIINSIATQKNKIDSFNSALSTGVLTLDKQAIQDKLKVARDRLKKLERNFNELVTKVDLKTLDGDDSSEEVDIEQELKKLLSPLIQEVKSISSRPREIERLKAERLKAKNSLKIIKKAIHNSEELKNKFLKYYGENDETVSLIRKVKDDWQQRKSLTDSNLDIINQKLALKEANRTTISESVANVFRVFFKSRGRNLIFAILAAVLFWGIFSKIRGWFFSISYFKKSVKRFPHRLAIMIAYVISVVGGIAAFMFVLYVFGDWVLLLLTSIIIFGILWTSKQALLRFWAQITLLLNIGPVREGEVVILGGVPWLVDSINLYSRIINPELVGGRERIHAEELMKLRSRPRHENERWFPTKIGDYVLCEGSFFGKVTVQTPELVTIALDGGGEKTFTTEDFLASQPNNISSGFRIPYKFGIDYKHQSEIFDSVIPSLKSIIIKGLQNNLIDDAKVPSLEVMLEDAADSSLLISVQADFSGEYAYNYLWLKRFIAELCVKACNEHGWVIPFNQVTVHMNNSHT